MRTIVHYVWDSELITMVATIWGLNVFILIALSINCVYRSYRRRLKRNKNSELDAECIANKNVSNINENQNYYMKHLQDLSI